MNPFYFAHLALIYQLQAKTSGGYKRHLIIYAFFKLWEETITKT